MYEQIFCDPKDEPIDSNILFLLFGLKMIKQSYEKDMILCNDAQF
jgi:hypothetical protein